MDCRSCKYLSFVGALDELGRCGIFKKAIKKENIPTDCDRYKKEDNLLKGQFVVRR